MPAPVQKGPFIFCPKSGKLIGCTSRYAICIFPFVGFIALLWHLIRIIPKPSRATYPCQQVAAPLAWGFVSYIAGLPVSILAFRKARKNFRNAHYMFAGACSLVAIAATVFGIHSWTGNASASPWTPLDPPNKPIGVARGINPGRVVWVRDASAVHWDGETGHWWDPAATDQARVGAMMSQTMRVLTSANDDKSAWNALFTSYNKTHGKGNAGYVAGQKIVIKINQNTAREGHAENGNPRNQNSINGNPHLILAMLRQLVHKAGVNPGDITIYDISRYIGDSIFVPCHAEFPAVHFVELDKGGGEGREAAPPENQWVQNAITYSDPTRGLGTALPPFVVNASYMINMAIMKNHGDAGPTLLAKNHFGTVHGLNHGAISPKRMGESNPLVDLLAHKDVGEKTVLFMIDSLYAADGPDAAPRKWKLAPFGTAANPGWPASLFASQDGVAIESVGFDFINAEWGCDPFTDNYLHEAALADNPPSGKKYGPISLGTHEHWNNSDSKQYSRNLGMAKGIELVPVFFPSAPTNISEIPSDSKIALTWPAQTGVTSYHVKRATKSDGPYTTLQSSATTSYTDKQVTNGSTYYYAISAVNTLGESADSEVISANPGAFVAAISCGGSGAAQFTADANYTDGSPTITTNPIDIRGLTAPAPQSVYQNYRFGNNFHYTFTGLTPGMSYNVRLHFAELYFSNPGQRIFNVTINDKPVLTNFDVIATAGTKNKAVIRESTVTADASGRIVIQFASVKDNAKCNAIEILALAK